MPPPELLLPVDPTGRAEGHAWWWLGVHGGAGVTTLERAVPGGGDAGRAWPTGGAGARRVVLVARSSAHGLGAAQRAAQQWAADLVPGVDLLGLVVVADAPGRRPRALRDLTRLVSGAVPRLWEIPWVEPWRRGEPPTTHRPSQCPQLARDLARLTQPA